jgi:hypothetical protein
MSATVIHHLLISALMAVETGSSPNPNTAVGDFVHGRPTSFGCLQISEQVLIDVRRITGHWFTWEDCMSRETSVKICLVYLAHYCTPERLHHEPTTEDYARCWNGGPDGPRKPSTLAYWVKVRHELDKQAGVWNADYTDFTPARLHVGRTTSNSRRPRAPRACQPTPGLTSDACWRSTERPNVTGFRAGGSFR